MLAGIARLNKYPLMQRSCSLSLSLLARFLVNGEVVFFNAHTDIAAADNLLALHISGF